MEVFALIIVGGVIAATVAAAQSRKATREAWRAAAQQLGIPFTDPGLLEQPALSGTVDGCPVRVDAPTGGGEGATTYTRYRVYYPQRLDFEMDLRRAGALSGLKARVGAQDIRVGAQVFDDRVVVKGSSSEKIRALLVPAVQTKVLRLFDMHTGAQVDEKSVRWESRGVEKDAGEIARTVRRLVDVALTIVPADDSQRRRPRRVREESTRTERTEPPSPREPRRLEQAATPRPRPARADRPPPRPSKPAPVKVSRAPGVARATADAGATARRKTPAPPPTSPAPTSRGAAPAPPTPTAPTGGAVTVEEACRRLFLSGIPSYETDRVFDAEFRGRRVRWRGMLKWVARYPFDRIFGHEHGARATLDVYRLEGGFGERTIQAVVQVPAADEPRLRRLSGKTLEFEGTLRACDGFRRQVYVAEGRVGRAEQEER